MFFFPFKKKKKRKKKGKILTEMIQNNKKHFPIIFQWGIDKRERSIKEDQFDSGGCPTTKKDFLSVAFNSKQWIWALEDANRAKWHTPCVL